MDTKQILKELAVPFDPKDIKWKPQSTNWTDKTAVPAAYADPRTYWERLDIVVGPGNWSVNYSMTVAPFTKVSKPFGKKGASEPEEKVVNGHKVFVIATVSIEGLGTKSSTGESPTDDENAATSAEAQAFKRACAAFGLGRYLYHLGKEPVPYDFNKRWFIQTPTLPDWAIPDLSCQACSSAITAMDYEGQNVPKSYILNSGREKYNEDLCFNCQKERAQNSNGKLSRSTR